MNWNKIDWTSWIEFFRKYLLNVSVLLVVLGIIYLLFKENGIISYFELKRKVEQAQSVLQQTREENDECMRAIYHLQNVDSLERYAREHYFMHCANEDVYIIGE